MDMEGLVLGSLDFRFGFIPEVWRGRCDGMRWDAMRGYFLSVSTDVSHFQYSSH